MLNKIKTWFKNSETIFLARVLALGGFITSAVGYMDWAPLWSFLSTGTEFSSKQLMAIGISVVGAGLTFELARRRNATDL